MPPHIPRDVLARHVLPHMSNRDLRTWAATSRAGRANAGAHTAHRRAGREQELQVLAMLLKSAYAFIANRGPHALKSRLEVLRTNPTPGLRLLASHIVTQDGMTVYMAQLRSPNFMTKVAMTRLGAGAGAHTALVTIFNLIAPHARGGEAKVDDVRLAGQPLQRRVLPGPGFPASMVRILEAVMLGRRRSRRRRTHVPPGAYRA